MTYKTSQRSQLIEFLRSDPHHFFSARELESMTLDGSISKSAIYRNLAKLDAEGVVEKSVSDTTKETVYRYLLSESCVGEIHIACTECGSIDHLDHAFGSALQKELLDQCGFAVDRSKTAIYGVCNSCRAKKLARQ